MANVKVGLTLKELTKARNVPNKMNGSDVKVFMNKYTGQLVYGFDFGEKRLQLDNVSEDKDGYTYSYYPTKITEDKYDYLSRLVG